MAPPLRIPRLVLALGSAALLIAGGLAGPTPDASAVTLNPLSRAKPATVDNGKLGWDTASDVDAMGVACMKASGYSFAMLYTNISTIWPQTYAALQSNGMSGVLQQGYVGDGQYSDPNRGTTTGQQNVAAAHQVSYPQGSDFFLDVEDTVDSGGALLPKSTVIAWVNNWAAQIAAAGYTPGVYVGVPNSLSASDLSAATLPQVKVYWESESSSAPDPAQGYVVTQSLSRSGPCGFSIDPDTARIDTSGNTLIGSEGGGGGGTTPAAGSGSAYWVRYANGTSHAALTSPPPAGFHYESTLGALLKTPATGRHALFSCEIGTTYEFTSRDSACEHQHVNGLLGYAYDSAPANLPSVQIYRCRATAGDHFDSPSSTCEGRIVESSLGYVLAYQQLNRYLGGADHLSSVAPASSAYHYENTLGTLLNRSVSGTRPLYACAIGADTFTSPSSTCEGQKMVGLLGYIYTAAPSGVPSVQLYRCRNGAEHFDSPSSTCEGRTVEASLGYAVGYAQLNRDNNGTDHLTTTAPTPSGYHEESNLGAVLVASAPSTRAIYACSIGADTFTSTDAGCERQKVVGRIGFVYTAKPATVPVIPLYRCRAGTEHFDSNSATCEGQTTESLLGYLAAFA